MLVFSEKTIALEVRPARAPVDIAVAQELGSRGIFEMRLGEVDDDKATGII